MSKDLKLPAILKHLDCEFTAPLFKYENGKIELFINTSIRCRDNTGNKYNFEYEDLSGIKWRELFSRFAKEKEEIQKKKEEIQKKKEEIQQELDKLKR